MRLWLAALLLLLAPVADAAITDDVDFSETYYARAGVGDIPSTAAVEAAGQLHVIEYLRFTHPTDEASGESVLELGPGSAACTCGAFSREGDAVRVGAEVAAGDYVVSITRSSSVGDAFTIELQLLSPQRASNAQINVYAPAGMRAFAPIDAAVELPCTGGGCDIFSYRGTTSSPLPTPFWLAVHPAAVASAAPAPPGPAIGWLGLAIGLAAGIGLWAFLVQRGVVQARSRRQVTRKAAHTEAAEAEPREVLEARKRVLMAGLKELEVAKMRKEVDDAVYDRLKAELKKEAVTAMRALEGPGQ